MGCICPGGKDAGYLPKEQSSIAQSQQLLEGQINNIKFEIKKADILKTKQSSIVLGTDYYLINHCYFAKTESESQKIKQMYQDYKNSQSENNQNLPYGDAITTSINISEKSTIKNIISVAIPIWRGGSKNELKTLEKCFQSAYLQAQNQQSVAFTDIASGLFGYPKQLVAQTFIKVTKNFMETADPSTNQLKSIHLLLRDDKTIQHFERSLQEQFPQTNITANQLDAYRKDSLISVAGKMNTQENITLSNSMVGQSQQQQLKQSLLDDNFEQPQNNNNSLST